MTGKILRHVLALALLGAIGLAVFPEGAHADPPPPNPPPAQDCRFWVDPPGMWMTGPCDTPPEETIPDGAAVDAMDELVPASPLKGLPPAAYDTYPIGNYDFILVCSLKCPGSATMNIVGEMFFKLGAWLIRWDIRALEYAYSLELFRVLSPMIQTTVTELSAVLWRPMFPLIGLAIAGAMLLMGVVRRSWSSAWSLLLVTVLLFAMAAYSFQHIGDFLTMINDFSTELSGAVLAGPSSGETPETAATKQIRKGGERIWMNTIHNVWALSNFGHLATAEKYGGKKLPGGDVLAMTPQERERLYKDHNPLLGPSDPDFGLWRDGSAAGRLVAGLLVFLIALLVYTPVLLLTSGAIIFFQAMAVLWACLTVVALLFSVLPFFGTHNLTNWFWNLIEAFMTKFMYALLLSVTLSLSSGIFALAETMGVWQLGLLLNMVLYGGMFLYRHKLFSFFGGARQGRNLMPTFATTALLAGVGGYLGAKLGGSVVKARQATEERRYRNTAIRRLDQRAVRDSEYRREVEARVQSGRAGRNGKLRHDPLEVQQEVARLRQIRESGGNLKAELQPDLRTRDTSVQARETLQLDQDVQAFRQEMSQESGRHSRKVRVADRERGLVGRWVNRIGRERPAPVVLPPSAGPRGGGTQQQRPKPQPANHTVVNVQPNGKGGFQVSVSTPSRVPGRKPKALQPAVNGSPQPQSSPPWAPAKKSPHTP